jgi:subtilisin family serine protease
MDIITASIGGPSGWSNNAWAEVADRITHECVVVTISAGNSGSAGAFFASSGSSGEGVIGVASVESETFPAYPFEATFNLDGAENTTKVGYLPSTYFFPAEIQDWPVVVLNTDTSDPADGCEPYPEGTPRIDGQVALVRRGTCAFAIKQANLQALGARYVLIYNNASPLVTPSTTEEGSLVALITANAGEAIIKTIQAGGNVTVDFSLNPDTPVGLEYPAGGRPNDFTSWGGTYDLQIKPDIAGPGGSIFSTYVGGGYAVLSGTSMACPYVAGVAALYIGAHGGREKYGKGFAKILSDRIISSGSALPWSTTAAGPVDYTRPAPVAQVGNGLIDAFKVVEYTSSLAFDKIALNDTRYFSRYHDVTVKNDGDKEVSYKFSTQPAAGVELAAWFDLTPTIRDFRLKSLSEITPTDLEPKVSLPRDFTLKPGQSKTVS